MSCFQTLLSTSTCATTRWFGVCKGGLTKCSKKHTHCWRRWSRAATSTMMRFGRSRAALVRCHPLMPFGQSRAARFRCRRQQTKAWAAVSFLMRFGPSRAGAARVRCRRRLTPLMRFGRLRVALGRCRRQPTTAWAAGVAKQCNKAGSCCGGC